MIPEYDFARSAQLLIKSKEIAKTEKDPVFMYLGFDLAGRIKKNGVEAELPKICEALGAAFGSLDAAMITQEAPEAFLRSIYGVFKAYLEADFPEAEN